jgi:leucine-rich repeat protein SHOC2
MILQEVEKLILNAKNEHPDYINIVDKNLKILPSTIQQLASFTKLTLCNNRLTTLPDSIGQLTNLERLEIGGNLLTDLPKSIGQLINLNMLELQNNKLRNLPESIGQLTNLTWLDLRTNQLTTLPDSIGHLTSLDSLDLSENRLTNLPDSFNHLTNLQLLQLSNNQFTSVPESVGQLINLKYLALDTNQLINLPDFLGNLVNLQSLNIQNNQLTILPAWLTKLKKLRKITLDNNPLTDLTILQSLPNLAEVIFFDLDLPQRYWIEIDKWQPKWLLDERRSRIQQLLVEKIGYERICQELGSAYIPEIERIRNFKEQFSIEELQSLDWKALEQQPLSVALEMVAKIGLIYGGGFGGSDGFKSSYWLGPDSRDYFSVSLYYPLHDSPFDPENIVSCVEVKLA